MADRFTWADAHAELDRRRAAASELGGLGRVARQHDLGKLTIRERIDVLCSSFREIGGLARLTERDGSGNVVGQVPSSYVCGLATIDGRPAAVGGEDFTIRGGAPTSYLDQLKGGFGGYVEELAAEMRIPLVLLIEGAGGDPALLERGYTPWPSSWGLARSTSLLGAVPVAAAVLGPAAGASAARATMSHFSVMSPQAALFTGGPPVVRHGLGQEIGKFELGGQDVHTKVSGVVDNAAADDEDALDQVRQFLSYLPTNVWELPPTGSTHDPADRACDELESFMPESRREAYDARVIVRTVADEDSVFEIGGGWGRSVSTSLARIDGAPVGIIANNPIHLGGALDARAAEKQVRFVTMCSTFHLPLVFFVDVPGMLIGPESERQAVLRWGARAARALIETDVPIVTVHTGRAYGLAVNTTADPSRLCLRVAWPSVEVGDLPLKGGVEAAFQREIAASPDPIRRAEEIEERLSKASSIWSAAEAFAIEDVIHPAETRTVIAEFLRAAAYSAQSRLGPSMRPLAWF